MTRSERIVKAAFAPLRLMPVRVRGLFVVTVVLALFFVPFVMAFGRAFSYSVGGTVQERYAQWFATLKAGAYCLLTGELQ